MADRLPPELISKVVERLRAVADESRIRILQPTVPRVAVDQRRVDLDELCPGNSILRVADA